MKQKYLICGALMLGLVGGVASNSFAAEKAKPSPEVEAKVAQALKAAYPEVVISSMGKESEDGLNFVAVKMTSKRAKMDVDVMEDGTIVESEEEADISTFPVKAAKALKNATKGTKILTTEIAKTYAVKDKNDSTGTKAVKLEIPTIAYEQDVEKDGKKGEFSVNAEGKILESPAWYKASGKQEKKAEEKDDKD